MNGGGEPRDGPACRFQQSQMEHKGRKEEAKRGPIQGKESSSREIGNTFGGAED